MASTMGCVHYQLLGTFDLPENESLQAYQARVMQTFEVFRLFDHSRIVISFHAYQAQLNTFVSRK